MRNLHLLRQVGAKVDLPGCDIEHAAIDSEKQVLYVTTSTNKLFGIAIATGEVRICPPKDAASNSEKTHFELRCLRAPVSKVLPPHFRFSRDQRLLSYPIHSPIRPFRLQNKTCFANFIRFASPSARCRD